MCVYTYLLPPPRWPDGFRVVDEAFLNTTPELKGEKWLKHGRAALLDGIRRERVPRYPCDTRWRSSCLGGRYARKIYEAEGKEEF